MTALAFQNAAMMRALARRTHPVLTVAELAHELGRDPSNTRRALKGLQGEGLVADFTLTEAGQRVLAAIAVAEGETFAGAALAGVSAPSVWPLDRIVRNPANRKIDPDSIPGMADSLAAQGQLQPITLTPVREDGMRMLLIGERRWLGAVMAAEQGRLPDSLSEGLRFEEREATAAEALAITLIENSERQDIPPLEEAFLLRDLADALDMTALAVAEHLGRKPRDVQDKVRIARNASPDALATYAQDGSWDRLRDSVTERKAAMYGPNWVNGTPYARRFDRHNPKHTAGSLAPELPWPDDKWTPVEDPFDPDTFETFNTGVTAHGFPTAQIQIARLRGGGGWVYGAGYSTPNAGHHETLTTRIVKGKEAFLDRETAIAAGVDLIRDSLGQFGGSGKGHKLPALIDAWLRRMESEADRPGPVDFQAADDPLVVNGVRYPNLTRANEARRDAGILPRHSNSGGGLPRPTPADPALPLPEGDQPGLSDKARIALIEIAHKTAERPRPATPASGAEWSGDPDRDFAAFGAAAGKFWLDGAFNELQGLRLIRAAMQTDQPPVIILTPEGVAWFRANAVDLPVSEGALSAAQGPGQVLRYATPWLEQESAPSPDAAQAQTAPTESADLYDRTPDQIAADAALLDRVRAFADQDQPTPEGADFRSLWAELGLAADVVITESGNGLLAQLTDGSPPVEILTADAGGGLPDERGAAVAWLTAWAIEQALGGPQGDRTASEAVAS